MSLKAVHELVIRLIDFQNINMLFLGKYCIKLQLFKLENREVAAFLTPRKSPTTPTRPTSTNAASR
jgi:hypothetical protein